MTTTVTIDTHGHNAQIDLINANGEVVQTRDLIGADQLAVHSGQALAIREIYPNDDTLTGITNVVVFKDEAAQDIRTLARNAGISVREFLDQVANIFLSSMLSVHQENPDHPEFSWMLQQTPDAAPVKLVLSFPGEEHDA